MLDEIEKEIKKSEDIEILRQCFLSMIEIWSQREIQLQEQQLKTQSFLEKDEQAGNIVDEIDQRMMKGEDTTFLKEELDRLFNEIKNR